MDYSKIPRPILEAIKSAEVYQALEVIAQKHSLHFDQLGELNMHLERMLVGIEKSSEFIAIIKKALEIDDTKSKDIISDINKDIMSKIRERLRSEGGNDNNFLISNDEHNETISAIENPSSVKTTINMIDHLLTAPVTIPKETTVAPSTAQDQKPVQIPIQQKNYAVDPYREQAQ